jgi:molybdopterin-binding protein
MQLSARNQLKGTVVAVVRGPVTAMVKLDIGGGNYVSATLTSEAADQLELVEGKPVVALFKASAVMIGVE